MTMVLVPRGNDRYSDYEEAQEGRVSLRVRHKATRSTESSYFVLLDGSVLGYVEKDASWTGRSYATEWRAYHEDGGWVGTGKTRNDGVCRLLSDNRKKAWRK